MSYNSDELLSAFSTEVRGRKFQVRSRPSANKTKKVVKDNKIDRNYFKLTKPSTMRYNDDITKAKEHDSHLRAPLPKVAVERHHELKKRQPDVVYESSVRRKNRIHKKW